MTKDSIWAAMGPSGSLSEEDARPFSSGVPSAGRAGSGATRDALVWTLGDGEKARFPTGWHGPPAPRPQLPTVWGPAPSPVGQQGRPL